MTAENIQSRSRGTLLMAISNFTGDMLVTTGNKSEMSVGYATIYGDMNGGYSVIKDVYKSDVFALCHWRNEHYPDGVLGPAGEVMPERMIPSRPRRTAPGSEGRGIPCRPMTCSTRSCMALIEEDLGAEEHWRQGLRTRDGATHLAFARTLGIQAPPGPPGVKLTSRSFGRDRRYPITNAFRGKAPNGLWADEC